MRIRYVIPIDETKKLIVPDHWAFPMLGGVCLIREEGGLAKTIEVIFSGRPLGEAPAIEEVSDGEVKYSISVRDKLLPFVKNTLNEAKSFLQCYFGIEFLIDDIDVRYEGETSDEEELIPVKSMKVGKQHEPLCLPFDMLTRAIWASEKAAGPKFEAALISAARSAFSEGRYIDSFRYSFLLIEFVYGDGQFKGAGLKATLKGSSDLTSLMEEALEEISCVKEDAPSDTLSLLLARPTAGVAIDHLVDKRGFYFHGNIKRKDAWKPEEQGGAKTLAFLTMVVASSVARQAASRMFDSELSERHFFSAEKVGALIMFRIKYSFRIPGEGFARDGQLEVRAYGTKVTPKMALGVMQQFLGHFEHNLPTAGLDHAECVVQDSEKRVFDIQFYNGEQEEKDSG